MEIRLHRLAPILLVIALPSFAQTLDHLEPDNSAFGWEWSREYYMNVATVLGNVLPEQSPRVYVLPSNINEYVIGIEDDTTPCSIVVGRVEQTLWLYESRKDDDDPALREYMADWPEDPLDVNVIVNTQSAPPEICSRIRDAWITVLLRTRYPDPSELRAGVDGVTFHFSAWQRGIGVLSGKIWSPERQSVPGKLVSLAFAMRNYARAGSSDSIGIVVEALATLETALE